MSLTFYSVFVVLTGQPLRAHVANECKCEIRQLLARQMSRIGPRIQLIATKSLPERQQSWGMTSVEFTAESATQFLLAKELIARQFQSKYGLPTRNSEAGWPHPGAGFHFASDRCRIRIVDVSSIKATSMKNLAFILISNHSSQFKAHTTASDFVDGEPE